MEQRRFPVFAERFAQLRGDRTQGEFASILGLSRPTVGFYENGSRLPDAYTLRHIAVTCDVSADWLLGISDERTINGDIAQASRYTGLSANSIRKIHELSESPYPHSKALLLAIDQILRNRPDDFITWVWRAAMARCCPKVSLEDAEFAEIRHRTDIQLLKTANEDEISKSVEVPIADFEDICTSTAIGIIRQSAECAVSSFKDEFEKEFKLEKSRK